jgi:acetyltransferase-like isoleucine patch superfamily enzyme
MNNTSLYRRKILERSHIKFLIGQIPRFKQYLKYGYNRYIAKKNGAIIGKEVVMPLSLAKKANKNLIVGNNTSIQTDILDLRAPIVIGNNVIIGSGVEILTCSHNIDSPDWEFKSYGIEIEDFAWLATRVFILPSCRKVGRGAVCAAGAVVVKNVEAMSVVTGNPASHLKYRKTVHADLVVESLLGADYHAYLNTRKGL